MTPHTFRGYGVNANDVTVILERITHWHLVDYNGRPGTRIELDTGKSVTVECFPYQVEQIVKAARTSP